MNPPNDTPAREITPPEVYFNRRNFMRAGALVVSAAATGLVYHALNAPSTRKVRTEALENLDTSAPAGAGFRTDEPINSLEDITHYNNFYEFSTDKDAVADAAAYFKTDGWKVEV